MWLPSDDTPVAGGYPVDALFPGLVAVVLALWGILRGQSRTRWFFVLLLLAAFILSLGPRLYLAPGEPAGLDLKLPYAWLYAIVPGFKALRAPVRFDALVMLSLAILAGYGVASFKASRPGILTRRWKRVGISALLMGFIAMESLVWPAAQIEPVPVGDDGSFSSWAKVKLGSAIVVDLRDGRGRRALLVVPTKARARIPTSRLRVVEPTRVAAGGPGARAPEALSLRMRDGSSFELLLAQRTGAPATAKTAASRPAPWRWCRKKATRASPRGSS